LVHSINRSTGPGVHVVEIYAAVWVLPFEMLEGVCIADFLSNVLERWTYYMTLSALPAHEYAQVGP